MFLEVAKSANDKQVDQLKHCVSSNKLYWIIPSELVRTKVACEDQQEAPAGLLGVALVHLNPIEDRLALHPLLPSPPVVLEKGVLPQVCHPYEVLTT